MRTTGETQLIKNAIEKFKQTTGIRIEIIAKELPIAPGKRLDALLEIGTTDTATFAVEAKQHLTTAKIALAVEQLRDTHYKGMLITDYVNPKMADRLKELGVAFIDLAGNAYLNEKQIFVYVKGNRLDENKKLGRHVKPTRAFQPTGLKVIFALLTNPGLIHNTYREIALTAGVALGTVAWVLTDLREHGFIYQGKHNRRKLIQKRKLIEQWVIAYPDKLRPKLRTGRYHAPTPNWWKEINLLPYNAQWGGEVAGAKLTNHLTPAFATIYAESVPARLLAENKLRADPDGDVEILKRFWHTETDDKMEREPNIPQDITHPLLVYADLMATADGRNIETAEIIDDRYLDGYIRKD